MIGLCDIDLQTATSVKLRPPNLEIMKLATYYKIEENVFCRLINLDETELSSYDKIYLFSEQDKLITIPEAFKRANNVIYGGTGFTNKVYIPFENEIIDYTLPRPAIYKEYLKEKYNEGIKSQIITHLLDDTYYRRYAGKNQLPIPPIRPRHRVFIYDRELFQPGWEEMIDDMIKHKPSTIVCIHPIICRTVTDYFKLREKDKVSRTNIILLELDIPLSEVDYMLKKYDKYFLADITRQSNIMLTLGGSFPTNIQYYKDMIYKLNLLYAFWARSIPIKIKYIPAEIGKTNPIQNLSLKIEVWANNLSNNADVSINDRIVRKSKKKKSPAHEERDLILKMFPQAADLFNQNYDNISQRRFWRL